MPALDYLKKLWNQELKPDNPMGHLRPFPGPSVLNASDQALCFIRALEPSSEDFSSFLGSLNVLLKSDIFSVVAQQLTSFRHSFMSKGHEDKRIIKVALEFRVMELLCDKYERAQKESVGTRASPIEPTEKERAYLANMERFAAQHGDFLMRNAESFRYLLWEDDRALETMPLLSEKQKKAIEKTLHDAGTEVFLAVFLNLKLYFKPTLKLLEEDGFGDFLRTRKKDLVRFCKHRSADAEGNAPHHFFQLPLAIRNRLLRGKRTGDMAALVGNKKLVETVSAWSGLDFKAHRALRGSIAEYVSLPDLLQDKIKRVQASGSVCLPLPDDSIPVKRWNNIRYLLRSLPEEVASSAVMYYLQAEDKYLSATGRMLLSTSTICEAFQEPLLADALKADGLFDMSLDRFSRLVGYLQQADAADLIPQVRDKSEFLDRFLGDDSSEEDVFCKLPRDKITWCLNLANKGFDWVKAALSPSDDFYELLRDSPLSRLQMWLRFNRFGIKTSLNGLASLNEEELNSLNSDIVLWSRRLRNPFERQAYFATERQLIGLNQGQRQRMFQGRESTDLKAVPERMWAELYDATKPDRLKWCLDRAEYLPVLFNNVTDNVSFTQFMGISEAHRNLLAFSCTSITAYNGLSQKQRDRFNRYSQQLLPVYQQRPMNTYYATTNEPGRGKNRLFGLSLPELLALPETRFQWAMQRIGDEFASSRPCYGLLSDKMPPYRNLFWENKDRFKRDDLRTSNTSQRLYNDYFSVTGQMDQGKKRREHRSSIGKCAILPSLVLAALACFTLPILMDTSVIQIWKWELGLQHTIPWVFLGLGLLLIVTSALLACKRGNLLYPFSDCKEKHSELRFFEKVPCVEDHPEEALTA